MRGVVGGGEATSNWEGRKLLEERNPRTDETQEAIAGALKVPVGDQEEEMAHKGDWQEGKRAICQPNLRNVMEGEGTRSTARENGILRMERELW